ncbi:MAG: flagellar motor switch phosphatase FliY, partial [Clostridia bacterium]|nr:flagellar motor switch phosphatase FliY [Clostridia bacterium]
MDGMLSQDEINALLNGMSPDSASDEPSDMNANVETAQKTGGETLTEIERDAIG